MNSLFYWDLYLENRDWCREVVWAKNGHFEAILEVFDNSSKIGPPKIKEILYCQMFARALEVRAKFQII